MTISWITKDFLLNEKYFEHKNFISIAYDSGKYYLKWDMNVPNLFNWRMRIKVLEKNEKEKDEIKFLNIYL